VNGNITLAALCHCQRALKFIIFAVPGAHCRYRIARGTQHGR